MRCWMITIRGVLASWAGAGLTTAKLPHHSYTLYSSISIACLTPISCPGASERWNLLGFLDTRVSYSGVFLGATRLFCASPNIISALLRCFFHYPIRYRHVCWGVEVSYSYSLFSFGLDASSHVRYERCVGDLQCMCVLDLSRGYGYCAMLIPYFCLVIGMLAGFLCTLAWRYERETETETDIKSDIFLFHRFYSWVELSWIYELMQDKVVHFLHKTLQAHSLKSWHGREKVTSQ